MTVQTNAVTTLYFFFYYFDCAECTAAFYVLYVSVYVSVVPAELAKAAWWLAYYMREKQATEMTSTCTMSRLTCMPATLQQV